MNGKVLISPSELSDLMKAEPVVLIDTRDPAIYAEAHIPGAVDVREVFTYLASSTPEGMEPCANIGGVLGAGYPGGNGCYRRTVDERRVASLAADSAAALPCYPRYAFSMAVMRLGLQQAYQARRRCQRREGVKRGSFGRLGDNESGR